MRHTPLIGGLALLTLALPLAADTGPSQAMKTKLENDKVRVVEVTIKPGASLPAHTHPAHLVYVLQGGEIKVDMTEGKDYTLKALPGEVIYAPAEGEHITTNTGSSTVRFLLVELKGQ